MGYQIYCGKGFDTQKAERFFKERRVPYQRVDVLKYGIGKRELESVAAAVGLDALCDRDSKAFRERRDRLYAESGYDFKRFDGKASASQAARSFATVGAQPVGFCPQIWEDWLKG